MTSIIQASLIFPPERKDDVELALQGYGITTYIEGTGELSLDLETETNQGILTCYLPTKEEAFQLQQNIANSTGLNISLTTKEIANEDWQTSWQKYWSPQQIGKSLFICPCWQKNPEQENPNLLTIYINPQMSFGTGTHETTQLCLELIEQLFQKAPISSFLDIGCGTGILSIAAKKLGATSILGLDIDPTIIENANENAALNNITDIVFAQTPLAQITTQYDLVCANILSSTLKELWPEILRVSKPNGQIILSGILTEELPAFSKTLNINAHEIFTKGEWLAISLSNCL